MENVKNDAICHVTRQNQYNPAGGRATNRVMCLISMKLPAMFYQNLPHSTFDNSEKTDNNEKRFQFLTLSPKVKVIAKIKRQ